MRQTIIFGIVLLILLQPVLAVEIYSDESTYNYGEVARLTISDCDQVSLVEITSPEGELVFLGQGQPKEGEDEWHLDYSTSVSNLPGEYTAIAKCFTVGDENIPDLDESATTTFTIELPLTVDTNKDEYEWGERITLLSTGCKGLSRIELKNAFGQTVFLDQGLDIWGTVYDSFSDNYIGAYNAEVHCGTGEESKPFTITFPLEVSTNKYRYHKGGRVITAVRGCNGISTMEITADPINPEHPRNLPLFFDQGLNIWGTTYDIRSDLVEGIYNLSARCGDYVASREICVGSEDVCPEPVEEEEGEERPLQIAFMPMQCGDTCDYFETILTCPEQCSCPLFVDCEVNSADEDSDGDGLTDEYELWLYEQWEAHIDLDAEYATWSAIDGNVKPFDRWLIEDVAHRIAAFNSQSDDSDRDGIKDGQDYCPGTYVNPSLVPPFEPRWTFENNFINFNG